MGDILTITGVVCMFVLYFMIIKIIVFKWKP